MAKEKRIFECQNCGCQVPKWLGRCSDCGAWNSFVESIFSSGQEGRGSFAGLASTGAPQLLSEVYAGDETRTPSGLQELDVVLGGGIVEGSAVLVGGDPGIGKSTLLLQLLQHQAGQGKKVLYVSGEESARQIRMRADRLGGSVEGLLVMGETDVEPILRALKGEKASLAVIDSVQTLFSKDLNSAPGTVSQVREVTGRLVVHAKTHGLPIFLVGHVTKDGSLAGPRVLEHMVDTVLYFEGDRGHPYRILRAVKNRFGSTNEIGVFEMSDAGLVGVKNASAMFLSERPEGAPGSAVAPCVEGTRTLLLEIQALVSPSAFPSPQRTASGVERTRIQILSALIERRLGLPLLSHDIFVNVTGGFDVSEPAADLAVVAALLSAFREKPIPRGAVFFGEVGLAGEVRGVSRPEARISEARELGFDCAFVSASTAKRLNGSANMKIVGVDALPALLEALWL